MQQKRLVEIIDTSHISKEKHINPHSRVLVLKSAVKYPPNIFGVSRKYIKSKDGKVKYKRSMIKNKLDGISWMKRNNKINGRKLQK